MATGIRVKDAMITPVITGEPTQTVQEAAQRMKESDIGSLVVIENGKPVGIVTREDIVNEVVSKDILPSKILIKDIHSTNLITCSPESDLSEAARLMSKYKYERIPVVSEGRLVGIISTREIAKVAPTILEIATEHLRIRDGPAFENEENSGECEICGNYSDALHYVEDKWLCDSCREEFEEL